MLLADLRTDKSPGAADALTPDVQRARRSWTDKDNRALRGHRGHAGALARLAAQLARACPCSRSSSPLALVGIMDSVPGTVLSRTVISWFLFGIEVAGHGIEEIRARGRAAARAARRCRALVGERDALDLQEENRIIERALRSPDKEQEDAESAPAAAAGPRGDSDRRGGARRGRGRGEGRIPAHR